MPFAFCHHFGPYPIAALQHELLLEPCRFNSVAVVKVPDGHGATRTSATRGTAKETTKRRWLVFVDKRRGLLGRKLLHCPTRAEPPPGRRRSYQTVAPLPASNIASGTTTLDWKSASSLTGTAELPPGHSSQHAAQVAPEQLKTHEHSDVQVGFKLNRDDENRPGSSSSRRRSLPMLKGNRVAQGKNNKAEGCRLEDGTTTCGLDDEGSTVKSTGEVSLDVGIKDMGGARFACRSSGLAMEEPAPSMVVGTCEKTKSDFSHNDAAAVPAASAIPEAQSPKGCSDGDEDKEGSVEIMLRGLNRPFLVAAGADNKGGGVFFVDHTPPADTAHNVNKTAIASVTVEKSNTSPLDQTTRGENINRTRAYRSLNCPTAAQTCQLRFLRWGAGQAITLVENLCNPIGMCIRSSDSSVFVLEEVWPRRQCDSSDHDQDRHRGGPQQRLNRGHQRHRVCRLDGARLSAWLVTEAKRSLADSELRTRYGPARVTKNQLTGQESGAMATLADHMISLDDDQSVTDWDDSSGISNDGGFDRHGVIRGVPVSSGGAPSKEHSSYRPVRCRRRQAVVDFVEVLELLPTSTDQRDDDRHLEQPIDLCVLTDGTIVLAFARPAPLHDGASVTERQGVIRAFPEAKSIKNPEREITDAALSANALVTTTPDAASGLGYNVDDALEYNFHDGWLVAEGLPVITGLAAGGGGAVYLSFRGARHDGVVTAIGSLSTSQRRRNSLVDPRREDFRGRVDSSRKGAAASAIGRSSPSGQAHANAGERNGGGGAHSGGGFVRVASGFASSLAVDDDMNL